MPAPALRQQVMADGFTGSQQSRCLDHAVNQPPGTLPRNRQSSQFLGNPGSKCKWGKGNCRGTPAPSARRFEGLRITLAVQNRPNSRICQGFLESRVDSCNPATHKSHFWNAIRQVLPPVHLIP
jgi:hypothetical protein